MKTQHGVAGNVRDKDVIDYLRAHPDFFITHTHLLAELSVPHASGNAISLIERQVCVLRDQNRQLRRELADLVRIARNNDHLNERLHSLTLALMACSDLPTILATLDTTLRGAFNADTMALRLFPPSSRVLAECPELLATVFVDLENEGLTLFQSIIDGHQPVCGKLSFAQLDYLFTDRGIGVASTALLPLTVQQPNGPQCIGLLAIGSGDGERFHAGIGTIFLAYMGAVIGRALRPYLSA